MNDMTRARLTFYIPFDIPNRNGSVLTKEAIESIVETTPANLPIVYKDNKNEYSEIEINKNTTVIGATTSSPYVLDVNDENQIYEIAVDCALFSIGVEFIANQHGDTISDINITGVGLIMQK